MGEGTIHTSVRLGNYYFLQETFLPPGPLSYLLKRKKKISVLLSVNNLHFISSWCICSVVLRKTAFAQLGIIGRPTCWNNLTILTVALFTIAFIKSLFSKCKKLDFSVMPYQRGIGISIACFYSSNGNQTVAIKLWKIWLNCKQVFGRFGNLDLLSDLGKINVLCAYTLYN